jgi:hypothetical protein
MSWDRRGRLRLCRNVRVGNRERAEEEKAIGLERSLDGKFGVISKNQVLQ